MERLETWLSRDGPWGPADYLRLLHQIPSERVWSPAESRSMPPPRSVWLRHDVEIDLRSALAMASAEAGRGMQATYFICSESPFLADSHEALDEAVQALRQLGHICAPHVVLKAGAPLAEAPWKAAQFARRHGLDERYFTVHAPLMPRVEALRSLAGCEFIYGMIENPNTRYHSDSGRRWAWGLPEGLGQPHSLAAQVLTHPVWWAGAEAFPRAVAAAQSRGVELQSLADFLPKFFQRSGLGSFTPGGH